MYISVIFYILVVLKRKKYKIMEREINRLVNVEVFRHKDELKLTSRINDFLEDTRESIEFINSSITYNTDTEEYVALISFYVLDEIRFLEDAFKD